MTSPVIAPPTQPADAPLAEPVPPREPLRNAPQVKPSDAATFRDTLTFLTPKPDDMRWASIPWQTDLWEARKLAAEQDKPIFAWMMNGAPLGCV